MPLLLGTGLGALAVGAWVGWLLGRRARVSPVRLTLAVFLTAAVGLSAFGVAMMTQQRLVAVALLGATTGLLGGLRWGSSDAFGSVAENPGPDRPAPRV